MVAAIRVGIIGVVVLIAFVVVVALVRRESDSAAGGDWTCSMHPQIRQSRPGKCPICGMDLVPVSQASAEKERLEKRAGVLTEPITRRELSKELRTVGRLDYNERQIAFITARVGGRVDRVHADFTGINVKKGDHLVDIYSPDLYVAQTELIRALEAEAANKKNGAAFDLNFAQTTLESARVKLRLLGLLPEQIEQIEKTKKPATHLTVYATMGGTVTEKNVRVGQYVKEGDILYRIADLDPLWLYLDIYEYDLAWVRFGQKVDVTVEAYPGERFLGTVTFLDPFLDDKTRTVKARVNLPNAHRKLKPAMYASAVIRVRLQADGTPEPTGLEGKYVCPMHPEIVSDKEGKCSICQMPLERVPGKPAPKAHADHEPSKALAIRASGVLDTGRRKVTYRETKEGSFEVVELQLGARASAKDKTGNEIGYYVVKSGLNEGDKVVIQGAFLLDSQRQIEGMPSLLFPQGAAPVDPHAGHGMPAAKASGKQEHKH